ncbi:MAG: FGGY-family carbohydrate kinase [Acidiferrobacteraceae bacterium]
MDLGTSGCRALAIDASLQVVAQQHVALDPPDRSPPASVQDPEAWWTAVCQALNSLVRDRPVARAAVAVAATSATCLLCDAAGRPLSPGLMYDDLRATAQAAMIRSAGGGDSPACHPGSSLSKLLWWATTGALPPGARLLHQADWIAGRLSGVFGVSDYHNALKLGFDAATGDWPAWLGKLPVDPAWLPRVVAPGTAIGPLGPGLARTLGLPMATRIVAGTTDSIAAFLASGASVPGDAVSSFGSTLVLKLLTEHPVFSPSHGVYSHRLGRLWLAGGASNAGGAALAAHFSPQELERLSARIDPGRPTGLRFYPLPGIGERFPVSDPGKRALLEPRPEKPEIFLQAMLEGLADIEAQGYGLLERLGAGHARRIWTSGRAGTNAALWQMRHERLSGVLQSGGQIVPAEGAARVAALALDEKVWRSSPILATLGAFHERPGTTTNR